MRLNAKQIIAATGGQFLVDPIEASGLLTGVTWDSREVEPGWLYVALPGEHVDGHEFVHAALTAGAKGVLVTERPDEATILLAHEMGASIIEVSDTYHAVSDLAAEWRKHISAHVIGITGSTGKTTTKNFMRDVLSSSYRVVATKANQNNELGAPRTILAADPDTEVVIVEMGMRGLGQITDLADIVCPDWGVITNVGESHIELLGSLENIASAKSELFEALPAGTGRAFVNLTDKYTPFIVDRTRLRDRGVACIGFCDGNLPASSADELDVEAYVQARDVSLDEEGKPLFTLLATGFSPQGGNESPAKGSDTSDVATDEPVARISSAVERVSCALSLCGLHNVSDALAAAAVGRMLGMTLDTIASALSQSTPESGRQEILHARGGFIIVNDAYNANPDSMRAALSAFCALDVVGRRYVVLGGMGELGDFAEACHRGIGRMAASLPIDCLICIGDLAAFIAEGALAAGMDQDAVICVDTIADVLEILDVRLEAEDAVLVKASRFMGLDRLVEGLVS